jgi:hypothetical protein
MQTIIVGGGISHGKTAMAKVLIEKLGKDELIVPKNIGDSEKVTLVEKENQVFTLKSLPVPVLDKSIFEANEYDYNINHKKCKKMRIWSESDIAHYGNKIYKRRKKNNNKKTHRR